jgi:hypothetical protein
MEASRSRPLPTVSVPASDQGPARRHWAALTVAVAWELARVMPSVRPNLFAAARSHAAWRLPADAGLADTEALAAAATREFLQRRAGHYPRWELDPDLDVLPDPRWRAAVLESVTPLHEAVFRLHYGDGVSLEEMAPRLKVDLAWLRPAREAVRELVRAVVGEDGVPTEGWDEARLDRLASRVALAAGDRCPGPGGLATEIGRAHGEGCPRCGRALRLIREGVIAPGDLFAPDSPDPPPNERLTLLQMHPDARKHARALVAALPGCVKVGDDQLLFAGSDPSDAALRELAEAGTPHRSLLRIVRAGVPGTIAEGVVVGTAVESLRDLLQILPWGEVRGLEPLPEPLPPPPSAARWWAAAGLVAAIAAVAGVLALNPPPRAARFYVSAERDATGVRLDADDAAYIDVFAIASDRAELLFHSASRADKAALATGDGAYHVEVDGRSVVVVASAAEVQDVSLLLAASTAEQARERIRARDPEAAVVIVR